MTEKYDQHFDTEDEARAFWKEVQISPSITLKYDCLDSPIIEATKVITPTGPFKGGTKELTVISVHSQDLLDDFEAEILRMIHHRIVNKLEAKHNRRPCIR